MTKLKTLTALEIAKIACDIEADGIDFYNKAKSIAPDKETADIFAQLADQEKKHLTTFRNMYKKLDEKSSSEGTTDFLFDDTITAYLRVLTTGVIFPDDAEKQSWFSNISHLKEVIEFAMGVEKASILFYLEIISANAFSDSKDLLDLIIKEEKAHMVMLNDILQKI